MPIDEIEAFELAGDTARDRGWPWRPPYWIDLDDGEWQVHAESENVVRINATTGAQQPETGWLAPLAALSIAKAHAASHGLSWRPGFSLRLETGGWVVGACQSQLGGQVSIQVSHQGAVVGSSVNPK